ncbi:hypothetical protein ACSS6W_001729 [Trichoderma asperelloides]
MAHIIPSQEHRRSMAPIHVLRELISQRDDSNASSLLHPLSPRREYNTRLPPVSLGTPEMGRSVESQLRVGTSTAAMQTDSIRDIICVCPPETKIPRPRNAFILYRQYHHSHVTAENPRLSNPQISKIIAAKWKNELVHVKGEWKRLAEEEKYLHRLQNPDYQYRPRRKKSKKGKPSSPAAAEEPSRCSKCQGRLIATPQTPTRRASTRLAPGLSNSEPRPGPSHSMLSPSTPSLHRLDNGISSRTNHELYQIHSLSVQGRTSSIRSPEDYEPASPEVKRRRTDSMGDYRLASGRSDFYGRTPGVEFARLVSGGESTRSTRPYSSSTLPELATMPRSQSFPSQSTQPPPRPWEMNAAGGSSPRTPLFDESLRLPPIQMPISPSSSRASMADKCETGPDRGHMKRRIWE